jgi:hypothetical protein
VQKENPSTSGKEISTWERHYIFNHIFGLSNPLTTPRWQRENQSVVKDERAKDLLD